MLVAAYAAINLRYLLDPLALMPHERVQARLAARVAGGRSSRDLAEKDVSPDATLVVASDGQATAYVLKRRVLSLVSPQFSDQPWTEDAVREAMSRFRARHLLVYVSSGAGEASTRSSAFLSALASGRTPAWLTVLGDNGTARLLGRTN